MSVALDYASQVATGAVIANKWVHLACERHLRDLNDVQTGLRSDIFYDPDEELKVLRFVSLLKRAKGSLEPFKLEPWQSFVVCSLLCWRWTATGTRRFSHAYVEVARKNVKSHLAAIMMLYCFLVDKEYGAEVYAIAKKIAQARIVWNIARSMVRNCPAILRRVKIYTDCLVLPSRESIFRPLPYDEEWDGLDTHAFAVDEIHAHPTRAFYDTIDESTASRRQPLMFGITTSGRTRKSLCGQLRDYSESVMLPEDPYTDDRWFAFVCGLDPGDDYTDRKVWIKANPNLGVSISQGFLTAKVRRTLQNPDLLPTTLRKHFCVWGTTTIEGLLDLEANRLCNAPINLDALTGERCFGALDLSSVVDTTGFCLLFPDCLSHPLPVILFWCWIPIEGLLTRLKREKESFSLWIQQGKMAATEGDVVDYDVVEEAIKDASRQYRILEIAYDRRFATGVQTHLTQAGITMAPFNQSAAGMNAGTRELIRAVSSKGVTHGGHPVWEWMCAQAVKRESRDGKLIMPGKKSENSRIDLITCAVMALDRAMRHGKAPSYRLPPPPTIPGAKKREALSLFT